MWRRYWTSQCTVLSFNIRPFQTLRKKSPLALITFWTFECSWPIQYGSRQTIPKWNNSDKKAMILQVSDCYTFVYVWLLRRYAERWRGVEALKLRRRLGIWFRLLHRRYGGAALIIPMHSVQTFRAKLSVPINERMSFDISPARFGARNRHLLRSETSWIGLVVYHLVRRDGENVKSMGRMHASVWLNLRSAVLWETNRERTQNVYHSSVLVYECLSDRKHVHSKRYNKWLDKII